MNVRTAVRLAITLAKREVETRYRGSVLGMAWALLNPVATLAVFTFVFGSVFKSRWGVDATSPGVFALLLFPGLLLHAFLAECLGRAPGLIVSNPNFVRKIVFPIEIMAVVSVLSALVPLLVGIVVLLAFQLAMAGGLPLTVLWVPLILLPYVLLITGISLLLAALGVYLRDLSQLINPMIMAVMFLSPVVYPIEALPKEWRGAAYWSPLTWPIESVRAAIFTGHAPGWDDSLAYLLAALVCLGIGGLGFRMLKRGFADVL